MPENEVVELLVAGFRVEVPREIGFEMFERHRALLGQGRLEEVVLTVTSAPDGVLHLLLGTGSLALLDRPDPTPTGSEQRADQDDLTTVDAFIDFDAYLS